VILLDTSVVSAILRRRRKGDAEQAVAARVASLLQGPENVAIPGIVLQEVLSGIADRRQHDRVLSGIRESFPVLLASQGDHLKAADLVNLGARAGVTLSTPDALIAAQAMNRGARLFSTDADFTGLAKLSGLKLL
jgi:predicted nucleic acid-binding protein